jgi:hypothetical protein
MSVPPPESWSGGGYTLPLEPLGDLVRIESEEVTPFHVGDAPFGDEPADMSDADAKVLGDTFNWEQHRQRGDGGGDSGGVLVPHGRRR